MTKKVLFLVLMVGVLVYPSVGDIDFHGTPLSGAAPLHVNFYDDSVIEGWNFEWNVTGGGYPIQFYTQNCDYTYTTAGIYTVAFRRQDAEGTHVRVKYDYITVYSSPTAAFSSNVTEGYAPLTVSFTDTSPGAPTGWAWDVDNDGSTDYTTKNCVHTYSSEGTYTVKLTVSNGYGSDSETKTDYITVTEPEPYTCGMLITEGDFADCGWEFEENGGDVYTRFDDGSGNEYLEFYIIGNDGIPYASAAYKNNINATYVHFLSFEYRVLDANGGLNVTLVAGENTQTETVWCSYVTGDYVTEYIFLEEDVKSSPLDVYITAFCGGGECNVFVDNVYLGCEEEFYDDACILNGDFETGDLTGWVEMPIGTGNISISSEYASNGSYSARLYNPNWFDTSGIGSMSYFDITEEDKWLTFDIYTKELLYSDIRGGEYVEVMLIDPTNYEAPPFTYEFYLPSDRWGTVRTYTPIMRDFGGYNNIVIAFFAYSGAMVGAEVYIDNVRCTPPDVPELEYENAVLNGNFEETTDYSTYHGFNYWEHDTNQGMYEIIDYLPFFKSTDGGCACFYSEVGNGAISPTWEQLYQENVDFTDKTNMSFEYSLFTYHPEPFSTFNVYIDEDIVYTNNELQYFNLFNEGYTNPNQSYLEWNWTHVELDVSDYTGTHRITFGVNNSGTEVSELYFDDVRVYSPPSSCAPVTVSVSSLTTDNVTAVFTGTCGECDAEYTYWYEYSATPAGFTMATNTSTVETSGVNDTIVIPAYDFPYINGTTYYYRLAREDANGTMAYGDTLTFVAGSVTPVPTRTYTTHHFEPFVDAEWDLINLSTVVPIPFIERFGYLIWAIFWGAIIMAFWVRQEDVTIPCFTYLVLFTILNLADWLPSSFVMVSWIFAGICLGAILYTAYRSRENG